MYCTSIDGDYLPCNNCKECDGLLCDDCEFFDPNFGCCLSKCDFKYSDVARNSMKEAKQYNWR